MNRHISEQQRLIDNLQIIENRINDIYGLSKVFPHFLTDEEKQCFDALKSAFYVFGIRVKTAKVDLQP